MKLYDVTKAKPKQLRLLKRLYKQAFPQFERKPWRLLLQTAAQGQAELLAVTSANCGCPTVEGLAICLFWQDIMLLDYLAVQPKGRSQGLGSQILPLLLARHPEKRLLLEAERPGAPRTNLADCRRRLAFYAKNGLQPTGLTVNLFITEYLLLWTAGAQARQEPPQFEEYEGLYNGVFGPQASKRLNIRKIKQEF